MAETFRARWRHHLNRVLQPLGLHLVRSSRAFEMDGLLARAAARRTPVQTWIDVGASDGQWSLAARRHFPSANFLLFEPLAEHQPALAALGRQLGFQAVAAVAGAATGNVAFAVDPALDGSAVAAPGAANTRTVPVETVDRAVASRGLAGPYGLKLDTHGYELSVLAGAAHVLRQASLVIVEAYNFELTPGSLRFHELCAWLEQRGFRCCDLADPMRRPTDGALWQMDLAFAPVGSPMFASNRYD
jgi:FkbM family methyltransferase